MSNFMSKKERLDPFGNTLLKCMYYQNGGYHYVKKQKWQKLGNSYQDALVAYIKLTEDPGVGPANIKQLSALYLDYGRHRRKPLAARTISDYEKNGDKLYSVFGEMPLKAITSHHVEKYIEVARKKGRGVRRVEDELVYLRTLFNYALKKKHWGVSENPVKDMEDHIPKLPERTHVPTCDDVSLFWAFSHPTLQAYLPIKLTTGARMEDILALKKSDILDSGHLRISFQKNRTGRLVKIGPKLKEALDDIFLLTRKKGTEKRTDFYLFETRSAKPYVHFDDGLGDYRVSTAFYSMIQRAKNSARAFAKSETKKRPNKPLAFVNFIDSDLRAIVAIHSRTVEEARDLLGHGRTATTDRYLRLKGIKEIDEMGNVVG